jgi:hypothetical protein
MAKQILINIEIGNAAFGDDDDSADIEIARILKKLAENIVENGWDNDRDLRDINGNIVGKSRRVGGLDNVESFTCRICGGKLRAVFTYRDQEECAVEDDGHIEPTHDGEPQDTDCVLYCESNSRHCGLVTGFDALNEDDGWTAVPVSDEDYQEALAKYKEGHRDE